MRTSVRAFAFAIVLIILFVPSRAQERRVVTLEHAFNAYLRGDHHRTSDATRQFTELAAFGRELRAQSQGWIAAASPNERDRRRLAVASVALEAAATAVPSLDSRGSHRAQARTIVDLIEWACDLVRDNDARLTAERSWHRAALALLQRASPVLATMPSEVAGIITPHLRHGEARFARDPRWRLANALLPFVPSGPPRVPISRGKAERQVESSWERAKRSLQPLLTDPDLRAEAHVRIGFIELRTGQVESALFHLSTAEQLSCDASLSYLVFFFRGQILSRQGSFAAAEDSYAQALALFPQALSSVTALAALQFKQGRQADAARLVQQALRAAGADPWRNYGYGDYRFWPELLTELRMAFR
jgi:tetratricopeptide (TPR) repeat protein